MPNKLNRISCGERLVVSDEWLDSVANMPALNLVATCRNRRQVGIKDRYVAYLYGNPPVDLEFIGDYAIGSPD